LLKYNTTSSKFENWTPNYLTSFTETDPIVKAITGIVKSNGTTISAAVAGDFPILNQNTTGNAATATTAATVTTAAQPAITSVGTLTGLVVSGTTTVITPVNPTDAANKAYVDGLIEQLYAYGALKLLDYDGNYYNTIKIGNQIWMAENLKTTKYNDGTAIPNVTDNTAWAALTTPAYCWYNNNEAAYKATYGALYNWYTVDVTSNGGKNVCPTGWHVPTDAEWTTLTTYLGGVDVAGGKLKETGTTHWTTPNTGATNETGFTALPGGYRHLDGTFNNIGDLGYWWSATEYSATLAWNRSLTYNYSNVIRSYLNYKKYGYSVRCVRD